MTEQLKADAEALTDLLQSRGWALYRDLVLQEIAADFEEHITKALDHPDEKLATDRMRQVAAVRRAGLRWLKLPQEKLTSLRAEVERELVSQSPAGRRGTL